MCPVRPSSAIMMIQDHHSKTAAFAQHNNVSVRIHWKRNCIYSNTRLCQAQQYKADVVICRHYCVMVSQLLDVGCPLLLPNSVKSVCQYAVLSSSSKPPCSISSSSEMRCFIISLALFGIPTLAAAFWASEFQSSLQTKKKKHVAWTAVPKSISKLMPHFKWNPNRAARGSHTA